MEANEFIGFTLPVVNAGPWSYFSNGGNSNGGNEGEVETMIIEADFTASDDGIIVEINDVTSKEIYDAVKSGKQILMHGGIEGEGDGYYLLVSSYEPADTENDIYNFVFILSANATITLFAKQNDYPSSSLDG